MPVYIGEFLADDFAAATRIMNMSGASWSSWTYKTVDMGDWGAFNYGANLKTDIQHDTYEAIDRKWSSDLTAWQTPGSIQNYFINDNRRVAAASGSGVPPL